MSAAFRIAIAPNFPSGVCRDLARAYGTSRRQVRHWRTAGYNVFSPRQLANALAHQHKVGESGKRLFDPVIVAQVEREVHAVIDAFEVSEKSQSNK